MVIDFWLSALISDIEREWVVFLTAEIKKAKSGGNSQIRLSITALKNLLRITSFPYF